MNPVQQEILRRLGAFPDGLAILRDRAADSARRCSSITTDETLQLAHQPWVAPEAYAVRFFAPAKKAWFAAFQERTGRAIPASYREVLLAVNGCSFYGLELYGLPPSMQGREPRVDRSRPQPLDLAAANLNWAQEYATDRAQFHFGSRSWTDEENVGYFWLDGRKPILRSIRKSGEVIGEWTDLRALLAEELDAAERRSEEETPADWWH
jgi:hypothetical protein